ncbi:MAG: UDP-2-acetamido-2-deoxy-ribo-hexuluronate aminotransferase [Gammaproteobacteria bacterium]|jgi:UDP-2-acetamido-2-deoxy-ribo-hexuluronate aminotransferase
MQFIDLKTQYRLLKEPVQQRINDVLEHGQYILGPEVDELEQRLAKFVGSRHCISVSSGTDALLVSLMALGIGRDDEVITTPFTFMASAEAIALLGATPVFVDIDPRTYNIDPTLIEAAITKKTKAVMPVNLFGQCAAFEEINSIAGEHGIAVVEDAAQSFGATYEGANSCGLSTIGCTSFFPSKPLGCYGDGGACFTNDDSLADLIREIRVHGQRARYHHPIIGVNGRLDTLQAAILLAKLDLFATEVEARARIGTRYSEKISAQCPTLTVPYIDPKNTSVYAQYTVRSRNRDELVESLKLSGIPTAVHYPVPLHLQPAFAGSAAPSMPVAESSAQQVLSLPMHPYLDEQTQDRVVEALVAASQSF